MPPLPSVVILFTPTILNNRIIGSHFNSAFLGNIPRVVLHSPHETTIVRVAGVNKSLTSYLVPLICNISIPHFGHLAIIQTAYQVWLNIATIIGILELNAC